MKKSEVNYDIQKIRERLNELKDTTHLSEHAEKIELIINTIDNISQGLTLGMTTSITGRAKNEQKCRFCGK